MLDRALQHGGEFADIFCERRRTVTYRLQDGRVHDSSYGVTLGVGIRVVIGESAGFACSDDLSDERAAPGGGRRVADRARRRRRGRRAAADLRSARVAVALRRRSRRRRSTPRRYAGLLERADVTARRYDPHIVAVNAHVIDEQPGSLDRDERRAGWCDDRRPLITLGRSGGRDRQARAQLGLRRRRRPNVDCILRSRDARGARRGSRSHRDRQSWRGARSGGRDGDDRRRRRRRRAAPRGGRARAGKRLQSARHVAL